MKRPQSVTITIPEPCGESWDAMVPWGDGRHCASCNKTVVDFTGWNDSAIAQFFSDPKNRSTCGNFFRTQLDRPFTLPAQPHSRLYRWVMAAGIAAISLSAVDAKAQASSVAMHEMPVELSSNLAAPDSAGDSITISGRITGEKHEPLSGAAILLRQNRDDIARVFTDLEGRFSFRISRTQLQWGNPRAVILIDPGGYKKKEIAIALKNKVSIGTMNLQQQYMMRGGPAIIIHSTVLPADRFKVLSDTAVDMKPLPMR